MVHDLKPYPQYKDSGVPWLGEIPEHWSTRRQRNVIRMLVSNVDKNVVEGEIPVRLCNYVDVYKNQLITEKLPFMKATANEGEIRTFRLRRGDVIITKDSESWEDIGVSALVDYEADDFICGYHLAILRPRSEEIDVAFLHLLTRSQDVAVQYWVSANGVTRFGLSQNAIKNVLLLLPPLEEQRQLVRFLAFQEDRINRFIRNKRRLIALLREQKQAIINQAVTRGIDPNVPLKHSGIPSLGDIPEHWEVRRLKHIFRELDDRTDSGSETLFSMRLYAGLVPHESVSERPVTAQELIGYKRVYAGQMVMNRMRACIGMFAPVAEFGLVSPDYAIFEPIIDATLEYFVHLFKTAQMKATFRVESKGLGTGEAGFLRLYTDRFGRISVPVPSHTEQDTIVAWIKEKCRSVDAAISRAEREIELMNEYRTRLIADVVTGKVDVRDVVVPDHFPSEEAPDENLLEEEAELTEVEDEASDDD